MRKIFMATIFVFLGFQLIPSIGHTEASKTIFVLFDLSGSTAKDEIRKEYLKNFKMIVDFQGIKQDFNKSMLRPGDVIVADIISGNSITDSTFPILKEFKNFSYWTDNKFRYGKYFRDNKEKLISKAEALLLNQRRKIMTTDIMSALRVAERIFRIFKKDGAVLVIMSDMIEESRDYNFARERLTGTRIQQILNREKSKGLPDFKGVNVYVAGCQAGNRDRFMAIRKFWLEFFEACGASLETQNYGRAFVGVRPLDQ